jgi:hypothetical protein
MGSVPLPIMHGRFDANYEWDKWDKRKNWMHKAKDPTQRLGLYNNAADMLLRTAGTLVVILHISSRMSRLPTIQATLIEYWNLSQCQHENAFVMATGHLRPHSVPIGPLNLPGMGRKTGIC